MILEMEMDCFIELSFGLFPGGVPSDLEKVAIIANKAVLQILINIEIKIN